MFSLDYSEFVSLAGEEDYINKMPFSSRLIKGVYYQHDLPLLLLLYLHTDYTAYSSIIVLKKVALTIVGYRYNLLPAVAHMCMGLTETHACVL